jgi:hypothetical protein
MDFFKIHTFREAWESTMKIKIGSILSILFDKVKKNWNLSNYTELGHYSKTSLLFIGPIMKFYGL